MNPARNQQLNGSCQYTRPVQNNQHYIPMQTQSVVNGATLNLSQLQTYTRPPGPGYVTNPTAQNTVYNMEVTNYSGYYRPPHLQNNYVIQGPPSQMNMGTTNANMHQPQQVQNPILLKGQRVQNVQRDVRTTPASVLPVSGNVLQNSSYISIGQQQQILPVNQFTVSTMVGGSSNDRSIIPAQNNMNNFTSNVTSVVPVATCSTLRVANNSSVITSSMSYPILPNNVINSRNVTTTSVCQNSISAAASQGSPSPLLAAQCAPYRSNHESQEVNARAPPVLLPIQASVIPSASSISTEDRGDKKTKMFPQYTASMLLGSEPIVIEPIHGYCESDEESFNDVSLPQNEKETSVSVNHSENTITPTLAGTATTTSTGSINSSERTKQPKPLRPLRPLVSTQISTFVSTAVTTISTKSSSSKIISEVPKSSKRKKDTFIDLTDMSPSKNQPQSVHDQLISKLQKETSMKDLSSSSYETLLKEHEQSREQQIIITTVAPLVSTVDALLQPQHAADKDQANKNITVSTTGKSTRCEPPSGSTPLNTEASVTDVVEVVPRQTEIIEMANTVSLKQNTDTDKIGKLRNTNLPLPPVNNKKAVSNLQAGTKDLVQSQVDSTSQDNNKDMSETEIQDLGNSVSSCQSKSSNKQFAEETGENMKTTLDQREIVPNINIDLSLNESETALDSSLDVTNEKITTSASNNVNQDGTKPGRKKYKHSIGGSWAADKAPVALAPYPSLVPKDVQCINGSIAGTSSSRKSALQPSSDIDRFKVLDPNKVAESNSEKSINSKKQLNENSNTPLNDLLHYRVNVPRTPDIVNPDKPAFSESDVSTADLNKSAATCISAFDGFTDAVKTELLNYRPNITTSDNIKQKDSEKDSETLALHEDLLSYRLPQTKKCMEPSSEPIHITCADTLKIKKHTKSHKKLTDNSESKKQKHTLKSKKRQKCPRDINIRLNPIDQILCGKTFIKVKDFERSALLAILKRKKKENLSRHERYMSRVIKKENHKKKRKRHESSSFQDVKRLKHEPWEEEFKKPERREHKRHRHERRETRENKHKKRKPGLALDDFKSMPFHTQKTLQETIKTRDELRNFISDSESDDDVKETKTDDSKNEQNAEKAGHSFITKQLSKQDLNSNSRPMKKLILKKSPTKNMKEIRPKPDQTTNTYLTSCKQTFGAQDNMLSPPSCSAQMLTLTSSPVRVIQQQTSPQSVTYIINQPNQIIANPVIQQPLIQQQPVQQPIQIVNATPSLPLQSFQVVQPLQYVPSSVGSVHSSPGCLPH